MDDGADAFSRPASGVGAASHEFLLQTLIDSVPDYLFVKDRDGRFVVANPAVAGDLGLTPSDLIGKSDFDLHSSELAAQFFADEQEVIASGRPSIDIEEFVVTKRGAKKWLSTSKLPLRAPSGEIIGIVGVSREITERKLAEAALVESESRWNFALESAGQGVWDHNLRDGTAYFSPTWRRMRGIGLDEPIDPSREAWLDVVHPDDRERLIRETNQQNSGELPRNSFEYRERHRDGHYIWILSRGKPVEFMEDGSVARVIGTDTDITSLKLAEAKVAADREETYRKHLIALEKAQEAAEAAHQMAESLARHDALTGLPNRRVFAETLTRATRGSSRESGCCCTVMIVDLDHFKPVNDINGHAAGDEVLREVAKRLGAVAGQGDTVARLGGDEFGLIIESGPQKDGNEAASKLAAAIVATISRPISIGSQNVEVGASVGIAVCPADGADADTLLRAADMAMYRAKNEGRGAFRFFAQDMENDLRERIALEKDVRQAVIEHEIQPYYQPVLNLAEDRVVGFEVLARWHHQTRGNVGPDVFIPIVEKLGLIGEMTYDLLRRACLDARDWSPEITIALNVSPIHLADPLLPVKVLAVLSETDFPSRRLEIEVTETSLVGDIDAARTTLAALRSIGIRTSLDDFGTGYSSLYNLRELHFDKIKIDRSFVSSMGTNSGSTKIVKSVIELAKSLGLPVVAEGIENRQQVLEIIRSGGQYGQGYYFGKAMPAAEALSVVQKGRTGLKRA